MDGLLLAATSVWVFLLVLCFVGLVISLALSEEKCDMFTKKDHNIRIVLREQLDDFLPNGVGLEISDGIERDVIDEITANGRYPDKFDGAEVRGAIGKALRARIINVSGE